MEGGLNFTAKLHEKVEVTNRWVQQTVLFYTILVIGFTFSDVRCGYEWPWSIGGSFSKYASSRNGTPVIIVRCVCIYACKVFPMAAQLFGTSFFHSGVFYSPLWQKRFQVDFPSFFLTEKRRNTSHYDFIPHRLSGHLWNRNRSSTQLNSVECFVLVLGIGCKR